MSNDLQKNELIRLINKGFPFEITINKKERKPGLLGYFQKKIAVSETRSFLIKEPTLETLDHIALASLDIDTDKFKDEGNFSNYIKKNSRLHYRIMAKIIAIALNVESDEEKELTEIFYKSLRPSELNYLVEIIDIASNLTDFMNSTLLVTAAQAHTAKAEIVEEELPDLKPHTDEEE